MGRSRLFNSLYLIAMKAVLIDNIHVVELSENMKLYIKADTTYLVSDAGIKKEAMELNIRLCDFEDEQTSQIVLSSDVFKTIPPDYFRDHGILNTIRFIMEKEQTRIISRPTCKMKRKNDRDLIIYSHLTEKKKEAIYDEARETLHRLKSIVNGIDVEMCQPFKKLAKKVA